LSRLGLGSEIMVTGRTPSLFDRLILPGFAFKAVVIGGGYATGRELAAFFLPAGPRGGLYGILFAMAIWSAVCALTFLFAHQTKSLDYRTFFRHLLGPFWPIYEIAYFLAIIVVLAVFAAAADSIAQTVFGLPAMVGALALMAAIAAMASFGNETVERLFKYVTFFLYGTYAIFVLLVLTRFGGQVITAFATPTPTTGWAMGGLTYAGYNIIGAIVILPVTRHLTSSKDALIAGLLAGPFAMLPAILFLLCMVAFYPAIEAQTLPSDFLLEQLNLPLFRIVFQLMIFSALLESGTGCVHAINERVATAYQQKNGLSLSNKARLAITAAVLVGSVFVAGRYGLVALIAQGFKWLSYTFLAVYVLPLATLGLWKIVFAAKGDRHA